VARILVSLALMVCTTGVGACAVHDPDRLAELDWHGDGDGGQSQAMGGRDAGPEPSDASRLDAAEDARAASDGGDPRDDAAVAGEDAGLVDADAAEDASVDGEVVDECPSDPNKTMAGACGCGVAEVCQGLIDALVHRYDFGGSSTTIADGVGTANGEASSTLPGTGTLTLTGGDHAMLPAEVVSSYTAVTIELWWTWQGGPPNQRLISFGTVQPNMPGDSACNGTSTQYYEGSWYRFCTNATRTGEQAWDVCTDAGGFLVAIESAQEQQYIADHPDWETESIWIGANDLQTEGQWYQPSIDGQQGGGLFWSGDASGSAAAGAYENWLTGEPANTTSKDCTFMQRTTRQWWAWECTGSVAHAACEWRGHRGTAMDRGVWFSPADGEGRPLLGYAAGAGTAVATGSSAFPIGAPVHVALVLDPVGGSIALFVDGVQVGSAASTAALSGLRDGDNWLGRSHLTSDPNLDGTLTELRIYSAALTPEQIEASHAAGPDPTFLP
jgi:hypothetical protein